MKPPDPGTPEAAVPEASPPDALAEVATVAMDPAKVTERANQEHEPGIIGGRPGKKTRKRTDIPDEQIEAEIRAFVARNQKAYDNFKKARAEGESKSTRNAQKMFGRNAIVKAVSNAVRKKISGSRISKTTAWKEIKEVLRLDTPSRGIHRGNKIGLQFAEEQAAEGIGDTTLRAVLDHELEERIRKALPEGDANDLISRFQLGNISEDGIEVMLTANDDQKANPPGMGTRPRGRKRQS